MKKILLSGKKGLGKFALVDDDLYHYLNQYKWFLTCKGYAARTIHTKRPNRIDKTIFMHRIINNTSKEAFTDHINRNKLDNRKENLRSVSNTQNQLNKGLQKNNTSGVVGVNWQKISNKWWARIVINRKQISLGLYYNLNDAIIARKNAESLYF